MSAKRPPRLSSLVRRFRNGIPLVDRLVAVHDEPSCICFTIRDDKGNPTVQYIGCPVHWKEVEF